MTTENQPNKYHGTPEEVGAMLFADALGSTIQEAMNSEATANQVARMMAGMVAAMAGTVASNFGPDAAVAMLTGTADAVKEKQKEFAQH
jgi:cell division protein FtsI/penicillin-binding protein 2